MPKSELTVVPQDQGRRRNPRAAHQIDDFLPAGEGHDLELRHKNDNKTDDDRTRCRQIVVAPISE